MAQQAQQPNVVGRSGVILDDLFHEFPAFIRIPIAKSGSLLTAGFSGDHGLEQIDQRKAGRFFFLLLEQGENICHEVLLIGFRLSTNFIRRDKSLIMLGSTAANRKCASRPLGVCEAGNSA
jgi:hypothetical protein